MFSLNSLKILLFVLLFFFISGCEHSQTKIDPNNTFSNYTYDASSEDIQTISTYTVLQGDTLSTITYSICCTHRVWQRLYDANRDIIKNPRLIRTGWQLRIPAGLCNDGAEYKYANTGELQCGSTALVLEEASEKIEASIEAPIEAPIDNKITLVTGTEVYAPFSGENLPESGMITEIVRSVFEKLGYTVSIDYRSWGEALEETKKGEGLYAATFPWLDNAERRKDFFYSTELHYEEIYPFYLQGTKPFHGKTSNQYRHNDSIEGLYGLILCRPESYYIHDLQPLEGNVEIKRPKTLEECFDLLLDQAVDVVPVGELVGKHTRDSNSRYEKILMVEKGRMSKQSLHLIFSKKFPHSERLHSEFNQKFNEMMASREIDQIKNRHLRIYAD